MSEHRGQPGEPGKPGSGQAGGAGGRGGTGGEGRTTGGVGGAGGAGGAGGSTRRDDGSDLGDRNEGRGFWRQTGVIPRWQLLTVYVLIVASGVAGFVSIKDSRRDAIERTCREQNERHDKAIAKLDQIIAELPPGPRKRDAEQRRPGTILLIDALAPKKDCEERAKRLVPGWP
jgi:hypothetical protein